MITIERTHEICMGHRVYGHESKCANLHGHNYVFEFIIKPKDCLDSVGRVVDFSEVKTVFCEWLESNWDHKTILWRNDPLYDTIQRSNYFTESGINGIVGVTFNPTAENIASYFLYSVAPLLTENKKWYLYSIRLRETGKCSATVTLPENKEQDIAGVQPRVPMPIGFYCKKQCGTRRDCLCSGCSDQDKKDCKHCIDDLPF
jgi:6-pyruvoyltetrahydropterin/6-carboxytetrahydropterin synthase